MGNLFVTPTADRVARGYNLSNKVAVVTGAGAGIGLEVSKTLARRGATVVMCCRTIEVGNSIKKRTLEQIGERFSEQLIIEEMEQSSLESVENFVQRFLKMRLPLDYLILNGAILGVPYKRTKEGFEMHFGVNYLAHFHLTQRLLPFLTSQTDRVSRIIAVCCAPRVISRLKLKNLEFGGEIYDRFKAYDQSKTALWYFTEELSLRLKDTSVRAIGVDPGSTDTWFFKHLGPIVLSLMAFARIFMNTAQQGAATIVFACLDRKVETKTCCFCRRASISRRKNIARYFQRNVKNQLYQMSDDLVKNTVFNSYEGKAFSPTAEIWRNVTLVVNTWMHKRRKIRKRRSSESSRGRSSFSYEKLE